MVWKKGHSTMEKVPWCNHINFHKSFYNCKFPFPFLIYTKKHKGQFLATLLLKRLKYFVYYFRDKFSSSQFSFLVSIIVMGIGSLLYKAFLATPIVSGLILDDAESILSNIVSIYHIWCIILLDYYATLTNFVIYFGIEKWQIKCIVSLLSTFNDLVIALR